MKGAAASVLLCFVVLPMCSVNAQETVKVGDRVRVYAPSFVTTAPVAVIIGADQRRIEGVVSSRDSTTLSVRVEGQAEPVVVPIASIQYLMVHRGQDVSAGHTAAVGFLVGATLGTVIGVSEGSDPPNAIIGFSAGAKGAILGVFLGAIGAGLGALAGASSNTGSWDQVPITGGRLSAIPILGTFDGHGITGVGVRVNLTF
jgi:hypothetical protein